MTPDHQNRVLRLAGPVLNRQSARRGWQRMRSIVRLCHRLADKCNLLTALYRLLTTMANKLLAVISVQGRDQKGVVAQFATFVADRGINIEDLEQRVVSGVFVMDMLVDLHEMTVSLDELITGALELGKKIGLEVKVTLQRQPRSKRVDLEPPVRIFAPWDLASSIRRVVLSRAFDSNMGPTWTPSSPPLRRLSSARKAMPSWLLSAVSPTRSPTRRWACSPTTRRSARVLTRV